jgi:prevent-host-death family protein
MVVKSIPAGVFKQTCLALLDEVGRGETELVVTKRGRPVARVVPTESEQAREASILEDLRGKGRILVEESVFLEPTGELAGWGVDTLA